MPLKIVRNDITKMETQAIVNTANRDALVGPGCDYAVYSAAGYDQLLEYRRENIGSVPEGKAFVTPGFGLKAEYIIHAVSPEYEKGSEKCEKLLRSCYRESLRLAKKKGIASISFPLISTGNYGYPKEEGMRIAVDEINAFLLKNDMLIYLVVFDSKATALGVSIYSDLEEYIDSNYVAAKGEEEYGGYFSYPSEGMRSIGSVPERNGMQYSGTGRGRRRVLNELRNEAMFSEKAMPASIPETDKFKGLPDDESYDSLIELHENKIQERIEHMSDTFSEYLLYLIKSKGMENADVWKRGLVDKKIFSKIKNNSDYHPKKITALRLCIGAGLNLDETRDLLARAGYALSPCDKTDIIFSYFIENGIYDMIELDIQLEEHGMPCVID